MSCDQPVRVELLGRAGEDVDYFNEIAPGSRPYQSHSYQVRLPDGRIKTLGTLDPGDYLLHGTGVAAEFKSFGHGASSRRVVWHNPRMRSYPKDRP